MIHKIQQSSHSRESGSPDAVNLMKIKILPILLFVVLPAAVFAEGGRMQTEIEHLLKYIGTSDCVFERNEKEYGREEAVKHIAGKYDYFKADIDSAEKFIELCASKSLISGKPYLIHCPGKPPVESRLWLLEELERFRGNRLQNAKNPGLAAPCQ